jgi:hypothetical protein
MRKLHVLFLSGFLAPLLTGCVDPLWQLQSALSTGLGVANNVLYQGRQLADTLWDLIVTYHL